MKGFISSRRCAPCLRINALTAIIECMKSLTIRNLDELTKARLRIRAAQNARSMEEEVREILRAAAVGNDSEGPHVADAIHRRFEKIGGVTLDIPEREEMRPPLRFSAR